MLRATRTALIVALLTASGCEPSTVSHRAHRPDAAPVSTSTTSIKGILIFSALVSAAALIVPRVRTSQKPRRR